MASAYKKAKKKVKKKKKFYKELMNFIVIVSALYMFNLWTSPGRIWIQWVIGFWAIGLAIEGLTLFMDELSGDWEQRAMQKELQTQRENASGDSFLDLDDLETEYAEKPDKYRDDDFV